MDKDEALKLALEALQWNWGGEPLPTLELQAINAIKEALAQSDQESDDLTVAYLSGVYDGKNKDALQPKSEQNPVAWQVKYRDDEGMPQIAWLPHPVHPKSPLAKKPYTEEPLYITPPQRKWVGLTEEDKNHCLVSADPCECLAKPEAHQLMEDVETKLREKNT